MQRPNELLEDSKLVFEGGESLFVAFESPSIRADFGDCCFEFDAADVQDVAGKRLTTTMGR
jgi:hypothetical protein